MEAYKCNTCSNVKPLSEFDKQSSDGPLKLWNIRKRCKECIHGAYLVRRATPKRLKAMLKASRNWKSENLDRHAELAREYRKRHPEKIIAQNRLNYAIRKGRVVRQPCEVCGSTEGIIHAHHRTYKKEDWYNVRWLCFVCHKLEHDA